MATCSYERRYKSWNHKIFVVNGSRAVSGVYQRDSMLSVADVAHELELCLVFDTPRDDTLWKPALLSSDTASPGSLIILDHQDQNPFPTPIPDEVRNWIYMFHFSSRCAYRDLHSLGDPCIQQAAMPKRRVDPRYLGINEKPQDEKLAVVPVRKSLKRSLSTTSVHGRNMSPSPARSDSVQGTVPKVISYGQSRPYVNGWRNNVLVNSWTCVLSGKGKSPIPSGMSGPGIQGPGIEVAHIVPQLQWYTFPLDDNGRTANIDNPEELLAAWISTWVAGNGITMLSHLYKCYITRLISIHPKTHTIRAFVDYDFLTDLHNSKAHLPDNIDQRALQHHWDMCCLENSASYHLTPNRGTLTNRPELPSPLARNSAVPDPSKEDFQQALNSQASNTQASGTPTASDTQASEMQPFRLSSFQVSGATTFPPSSPSSKPGSGASKLWRLGHKVIRDQARAEELWRQGYDVVASIEDDAESSDEKWDRGRSLVKRSCVATIDGGDEETPDAVNKRKKQRLE
ncbi:hypothetical protein VM1G_09425 [Cytospora mali]|uniref:HNH nuclease domain-containing protein n=1 Tax=Cytospora mali TaxID=578113 RepID=A0A194WCJ7_CYTMA|nr:hypothetical protein VM1G_09425 [Valsa mali]